MKRRELIKKSLLAATNLSIGNLGYALKADSHLSTGEGMHKLFLKQSIKPVVEIEEEVYQPESANNGAGPLWCKGSALIVRIRDVVFASGLETIPHLKPMNNCRWILFERTSDGWKQQFADNEGRTREPSPMAAFHDGSIFVSANPTLAHPNKMRGPSRPEIFYFKDSDIRNTVERHLPEWSGCPDFTQHSYRSFAADGPERELVLFQNVGSHTEPVEWVFRDAAGNWSAAGQLEWPWGEEYEEPLPIRLCYPCVALKDRKVYFFGAMDIKEPKTSWREYKKQITGNDWDYVFRRLFITWSDDITSGQFHNWSEIASREDTGGYIVTNDLWVAPDETVHLLWHEVAIDERLRDKFFAQAEQSVALQYAIFNKGKVEYRQTILLAKEGQEDEVPLMARFHVTKENRLLIVYSVRRKDTKGKIIHENRIMELSHNSVQRNPVKLQLKNPFVFFYTSTIRAGSTPSDFLDLYGAVAGLSGIHYARIRLDM